MGRITEGMQLCALLFVSVLFFNSFYHTNHHIQTAYLPEVVPRTAFAVWSADEQRITGGSGETVGR